MKSQWQHFYQKFHLILDTLSWETSLFVISEVLGLFGNTLTADDMYSRHYLREIFAKCSNANIWKTENIFLIFYYIFAI